MPINDMGGLNNGWGICGFTSSLYALYTNRPGEQGRLAKGGATPTVMLAEIKSYLRMLQADGRNDLLSGIETFTQSFGGPFATFTVENYIAKINKIGTTAPLLTDELYGIAMPPLAVVDYLKRCCELRGSRLASPNDNSSEMILGVRVSGQTGTPYDGLIHYVYQLGGKIHSWGLEFNNLGECAASQNASWDVAHKIAVAG